MTDIKRLIDTLTLPAHARLQDNLDQEVHHTIAAKPMQITVYGTFARFRSWQTFGHIYGTATERSTALRAIAKEHCDDIPEDADDEALVCLLGEKEHEIHLFDSEIVLPP